MQKKGTRPLLRGLPVLLLGCLILAHTGGDFKRGRGETRREFFRKNDSIRFQSPIVFQKKVLPVLFSRPDAYSEGR